MLLLRRVREGVGVHRVEAETKGGTPFLQLLEVGNLVPRNMQRDRRRRARQFLNDGAVLQLVIDIARLAIAGEAGEARAAGADTPGGHGDRIGRDLGLHRIDIDAAAGKLCAEMLVVAFQIGDTSVVLARHHILGNHRHQEIPQRVKDWALPASTLTMLPVDFADMSEARK